MFQFDSKFTFCFQNRNTVDQIKQEEFAEIYVYMDTFQ